MRVETKNPEAAGSNTRLIPEKSNSLSARCRNGNAAKGQQRQQAENRSTNNRMVNEPALNLRRASGARLNAGFQIPAWNDCGAGSVLISGDRYRPAR